MQLTSTFFVAIIAIATGVAAQCAGNAKANEACTGDGSCGDEALGLCGSAGFECQNGVCRKKSGVYCALVSAGECVSGSTCVSGAPTVGNDFGPTHCS